MANPWFRLYSEAVDDEKLRLLAFEDRWHFVAILCCKCQGVLDGENTDLIWRKVAVKLGLEIRTLEEVARRLAEVDLIDAKTLQPLAWDERQYQSDNSTNRVRKYRERQKKAKGNADETLPKRYETVSVTAQDTDTDTDTDTDKDTDKDFSSDSCEPDADDSDESTGERGAPKPIKYTPEDRDMAASMLAAIREVSPSTKGSKKWPDTIRLMRERDGRTHDEIQAMFAWANADDFWRAVILSPGNLREKWPQLEAQRNRKASAPAQPAEIRRPRKSLVAEFRRDA